jgi:hypothetical protein
MKDQDEEVESMYLSSYKMRLARASPVSWPITTSTGNKIIKVFSTLYKQRNHCSKNSL